MAGVGGGRTLDYAGPPPDPPPDGPELASPPDYEQPLDRPVSWTEKEDDGKGDEDGAKSIYDKDWSLESKSLERGETSRERGETSRKRSETSRKRSETDPERIEADPELADRGAGSAAPSGSLPLLRDDTSAIFRRMAALEEWEDRQILITNGQIPPGSGESALALGEALTCWKRLLGLTVPGGWHEEYQMPSESPRSDHTPPMLWKLLTSAWMLAGVAMVFTSIGLQWAYCKREYYGRMLLWPEAGSNTTSREYLCVPSFVWAILVPRLVYVFGYVAIFVCIFCLKLADFEYIVARAYDVITDQRQNRLTTMYFISYCRRDPCLLAFWFVVIHGLSLVSTLLGEDIVRWDLTEVKPLPTSTLEWATYVTTCLVRLMTDGLIGYCIVTYSLSTKYLELMIERSTWYLQTLVVLRSSTSACQYFFNHVQTVVSCVEMSQPCASAALLLAMLRICQTASQIWQDQTSDPIRSSSLAQLPIAILFFFMLLHHIRRCISLTEAWLTIYKSGPDFRKPPYERRPPHPDPLDIHQFSAEEEKNRATVLWFQIVRQCPQVAGHALGLRAAHWMYWALLVVVTLYCVGFHALLRHAPLI